MADGAGVAAGGVGHGDAVVVTVGQVDMVGAYCGCGYHADVGAVEQGFVAVCAGADDEAVGVLYGLAGDFAGLEVFGAGRKVEHAFDVRYVGVDYDSRPVHGPQS